jgi:hypothetical protein
MVVLYGEGPRPATWETFAMIVPLRRVHWFALALAAAFVTGSTAPAAETILPPARTPTDPAALARRIDDALDQALAAQKVRPAPLADDAEFLRRVCLDLIGVPPTADRAAAFLDSTDPDKRAKLIDELLSSPRYGRHMADVWQGLLVQRDADNRRIPFEPLDRWLEDGFNRNKPWDRFASEVLTASGSQDDDGAVTFYLANLSADKMTDRVTRVFLGVRLQCAQCHNHPFTPWKRTDYWGMAAFFEKVHAGGNVNKAAKQGGPLVIGEEGRGRPVKRPDSAKVVPARFFLGAEAKVQGDVPRRPVLAAWLTSADNPYFARALVNRVWGQFFGHGFVNPVDDFRDDNPASHPELLRDLSARFAAGGFDVKGLIRVVCNTRAYQRTSRPSSAAAGDDDVRLFGRLAVKPLTPEQLYDSLEQVVGKAEGKPDRPRPQKAPGAATPRSAFVNFFRADDTADPTEYQAGIPQALRLMNAPQLTRPGAALTQALKAGGGPARVTERLYLAALARRPTAAESRRLLDYVARHDAQPREAYGDILWALLNSSEFALNH